MEEGDGGREWGKEKERPSSIIYIIQEGSWR